jgi:hypothetical protein
MLPEAKMRNEAMPEMYEKPGPLTLLWAFGGFFLVLFFVFWMLDTEYFRGNPDEGGQETPVRDDRAVHAHAFCARYITQQLRLDPLVSRSLPDYTVWDIGFNRYLVKAAIERADDPTQTRHYLCRILRRGGDPQTPESWTVQGVESIR